MILALINTFLKAGLRIIRNHGFIVPVNFIAIIISYLLAMARVVNNHYITGFGSLFQISKSSNYSSPGSFFILQNGNVLFRKTLAYQCCRNERDIIGGAYRVESGRIFIILTHSND